MWKKQQLLWRLINVYCHLFYNKYIEVTVKYCGQIAVNNIKI